MVFLSAPMIIVRGREGLHFDKHLGLYCRVGIVHKHTQSLQVALCDITQTQCTIYQHHLPGTFSLLDPAALLSESFSVLRGAPCCHNTHHHMATTPIHTDIGSKLVNAWPKFLKLILFGKVWKMERISLSSSRFVTMSPSTSSSLESAPLINERNPRTFKNSNENCQRNWLTRLIFGEQGGNRIF